MSVIQITTSLDVPEGQELGSLVEELAMRCATARARELYVDENELISGQDMEALSSLMRYLAEGDERDQTALEFDLRRVMAVPRVSGIRKKDFARSIMVLLDLVEMS